MLRRSLVLPQLVPIPSLMSMLLVISLIRLELQKNSLNLKRLEKITERSYSDAVASTSKIVEVEESPKLLERFTSLELSDKEAKASRQKEKRRKLRLEKKFAKSLDKGKGKQKESVHPAPINKDAGNVKG